MIDAGLLDVGAGLSDIKGIFQSQVRLKPVFKTVVALRARRWEEGLSIGLRSLALR